MIRIRVTRPCCIDGQPVAAGTVLRLPPLAAAFALDSGRCELVDGDDAPEILRARREAVARTVRQAARPLEGGPWQRVA